MERFYLQNISLKKVAKLIILLIMQSLSSKESFFIGLALSNSSNYDSSVCVLDRDSNIVLLDNARLFAEDIQINQLLGGADALISDYSSVAVDYLALDRPMAFMLEDVKAYEESRGFVFDNVREWLPGQELYSFEDVCTFVSTLATGTDPAARKREKLRKLMNTFCDGDNCRRITEALGITKE